MEVAFKFVERAVDFVLEASGDFFYKENPKSSGAALSNVGYVDIESRKNTMEEIMKQLEESTVRIIGVHGPSGVGKTYFVKEIAKKARDKKLFDVVIIEQVTRNPNYEKIQKEIACRLGLTFEGEGENGRADRLTKRLKQKNENTLIILDDLWGELSLNMFGISFDDDDLGHGNIKDRKDFEYKKPGKEKGASDDYDGSPSGYKRCKILLTSRSKEVLSDKMNVKENSIFPLMELNDEEAMKLFKQKAEMPDENPNFISEIVKYCAGLPMAIHMVGKTLRNESESVWEETLKQLKKSSALVEVQNSMEISMKRSYDHLESEEKSIFSLCAQMGHQPLIMDLVKYCIGLGIFKGVHTLGDARNRVSKSIQKLKKSSLLLDDNSNDHYNMHDLHRDVALSIARKVENVFTWRNDKLDIWPNMDELERCTVISIYKSDIVDELLEVINCPRLRVFHIDSDYPSLNIPDGFFARMEELRVLILTGIRLQSLPSSIKCLSNLRMLCLERCDLGNLSIIRDLKNLRILSLSGSRIEGWPAELGDFSKLQLLDISDCSIGNLIPPCFISSLSSLEEFYIGKSLITMEVEGETKQSPISDFSQLKHLHELKIIDVCIPSADVFPTDLLFDKLDDYKIVIGDFKMLSMGDFRMPKKYEASRSLALQVEAGMNIQSHDGIKILFKRVENLLLGELNEVQNVVCELNLDGFPDLKKLSIVNNAGIEYIVNSMGVSYPLNAFPKLEFLSLFHLMKIEKICCSPLTDGSFSKLKTIKVKACTKLKNLFSFCVVKFLGSLETIDVSECVQLKEIVDQGEVFECDQLKEIVDHGEVSEKIEFHGLCSLTLQDLPSLTSFYTNDKQSIHRDQTKIVFAENDQSVTPYLSLFGEKVEIPNLESLNLSSIKIHKIWSNQLSSFCFRNLIKLTVDDCCNLTYLCPLSVASNLNKLKGLFVSECQMMETLFATEGGSKDYSKECIFPKLEEIQLRDMDMLKDIWPAEVSAASFPSLISVYIASCRKLDKIFPSHMNGWYGTLDNLKVAFCESVEVIFEIRCPSQQDAFDDTKLQLIDLTDLPNLKQVWSRDPNGVFSFTNLRSLSVSDCDKLSYVLPSSVAKGLAKLEYFSIQSCVEMKEIVAGLETNNELVFPEITSINFDDLQNMSCFYKGRHPVECPKLKRLAVNKCSKLKTFTTESSNEEERPVFSAEKVISNLEYLEIGQKEAEWLKSNIGKYRMHCLKQLCLKSVPNVKILYWLLHRIPNLERLQLSDDPLQRLDSYSPDYSIRELVPSGNTAPRQRLGAFWQLKELTLSFSDIEDIGFERDPLLQRLERLVIYSCGSLINLAHHTVSFTQLTYLEVSFCSKLEKLMESSTAKSLVRLTTMKVMNCRELEEIVTNDDEGNEEEQVVGNIVFGKLITIELGSLAELTCFCRNKNCDFSFPLLEKLILRDCPKMKTFTQSRTRAPKLQNVLVAEGIFGEEKWYWQGDLNATIQKVSIEHKSRLELSGYPELERVWCGKVWVPKNSFQNLKSLAVANIGYLVHVIPSHLLPCFKNLEELQVESCDAVQVIFNINDNRVTKAMGMFRFKKLSLRRLPRLEQVCDKDLEGVIGHQTLEYLSVKECSSLKFVFPASATKELSVLENLSVEDCEQLVEIFAEDETASEGIIGLRALQDLSVKECGSLKYVFPASVAKDLAMLKTLSVVDCVKLVKIFVEDIETASERETKSFVFRSLSSLKLRRLPELKYFCPGLLHNLEFPVLEELYLDQCKWVILSYQEADAYQEGQALVAVEKVSVESKSRLELSGYPELEQAWCGKDLVPKNSFRNLKSLAVANIGYLVHVIPSHLLPCLKNLEELKVESCDAVQVIFNINDNRVTKPMGLFRFKKLPLRKLPRLEHVWDKDPEGIIGHRTLQFLSLRECNRLKYVFPASVAKELGMLENLSVVNCEQLVEIFAEDETAAEGGTKSFVFHRLTSLELRRLPELKYFYPGLHNLEFPVLEELRLHQCKWVILSCPEAEAYLKEQVLVAVEKVNLLIHNLKKLSFDMGAATVTWDLKSKKLELKHLLNFSELSDGVLYRFLQTVLDIEMLEVTYSSLKEMFSAEIPNANYAVVLSHLKRLRLYSVDDLKSIGLEHSWIHPIPTNLQTLQVEWCHQLKNLVPAAGTVSFSNLTDLAVSSCRNLLYLFMSSTAKSLARLERMEIRNCESMQEIVSTEGDESPESGQIIFEQLQSLSLTELPMLRGFYLGSYILCFPSLKELSIYNCLSMQTFCPLIMINQDSVKLFSGSGLINKDPIRWEGDINTTIRKFNEKKIAESARELRDLKLGFKPLFQEMWCGSLPVPDVCFSNLETLVVDGCEFLSQVLPSNLLPFLNKMHKLEVRNCSSVKAIFDVKYIPKDRKMSMGPALLPLPFSLKTLVLEELPNLESVWNVDSHCEGLSEIVARVKAASEGTNLEFTFPSLTSLTLLDLPKLECCYCSLRCVQLKRLDQDPYVEDQACAKEITPNLDNLSLGEKELKMIWHGQCQGNHLHKIKVLDLQGFNVESNELPCGHLQKLPNIEELVVSYSSFKEVFCVERPNVDSTGFLSQLKGLKLASLSELISIGLEHPWVEESFLKNLETLEATSCSRLRNLVPSSTCFSSLMHLTIFDCDDMMHLFTSSTAKSLAQLEFMYISRCKSIQEVVSKEGGESHHDEIVFGQLQELNLKYLPNLERFYKGSCILSFPSLEKLSVFDCGRMDTFCAGTVMANKLSAVKFDIRRVATPLEDDLNFTIHKAFKAKLAEFVKKVKNLKLLDKPEIYAIWHGSFPVPSPCFINLKSLIVERCEFLSTAIPYHILCLLCKLEELEVRQCHSVNTIFEVKDMVKGKKKLINAEPALSPSFRLKKLTFEQLPNLEQVWDSDPQEVIGLQNLQEVYVNGCDSLERLFPASVAKRLTKLEKLEVQQCGRLVEIVAKDEAAKEGATKAFVMPCMTSIKLWFLPKLEYFYPGPHKLECPKLTQVHLLHCDKLNTFTCESQTLPEAQSEYQVGIPLNPLALFLLEEVIPCLEFLAINKEMAMLIWHEQFHAKLLHKLETVQLQCFHDDSDTFPYGLLQKVPNTEKLVVSCSSFKEIFSSERPAMDCAEKILSHVKCLKLSSMAKLNSIGLEHSWVDPISENIEKLQLDQCDCLRNIVPCKVSFSSLTDLNVSQCGGLASLFTPSTSRTLSQLKSMSIENCKSLEEIVSEEAEESSNDDEEQITFHKLETLSLHSLPRLGRFYGGSLALSLPSLDELSVINCCKMESFCAGPISVNVNRWTTFKFKEDQPADLLIVDLNSAIRKAFEGMPLPRSIGIPRMW